MDIKQIKELMAAMEKGGLKRLRIKQEKGFELELERAEEVGAHVPMRAPEPHFSTPALAHPTPPPVAHRPHSHEEEKKKEMPGKYVKSPMVGTFYTSPSPDDPVFVKVGDRVEENTVVCIIEAMKVMNEVKAGVSGQIAEILVDNAHPVEFGSKLFRIV